MMSLSHIASVTSGKIVEHSGCVQCPIPGRIKNGRPDKRLSISVWPRENGGITINVHRPDVDVMTVKRELENKLGIKRQPKRQAYRQKKIPTSRTGETIYVAEVLRAMPRHPTREQFALLLNEHRRSGDSKDQAFAYADRFAFGWEDVEGCYASPEKHFSADEKAALLGLTYERRSALHLRTIGAIDLDKAGRDQLRNEKRNAYKRAKRAAAKQQSFALDATPAIEPELGKCEASSAEHSSAWGADGPPRHLNDMAQAEYVVWRDGAVATPTERGKQGGRGKKLPAPAWVALPKDDPGQDVADPVNKIAGPMVDAAVKGGRILAAMAEAGERQTGGGDKRSPLHGEGVKPTLTDLGFSSARASRWQTAGELPDELLDESDAPKITNLAAATVREALLGKCSQTDRSSESVRDQHFPNLESLLLVPPAGSAETAGLPGRPDRDKTTAHAQPAWRHHDRASDGLQRVRLCARRVGQRDLALHVLRRHRRDRQGDGAAPSAERAHRCGATRAKSSTPMALRRVICEACGHAGVVPADRRLATCARCGSRQRIDGAGDRVRGHKPRLKAPPGNARGTPTSAPPSGSSATATSPKLTHDRERPANAGPGADRQAVMKKAGSQPHTQAQPTETAVSAVLAGWFRRHGA